MAPTLFALFAAATLERKSESNNDQRKLAAKILAREYGLIPETEIYPPHPDELAEEKRRKMAVDRGEIFGSAQHEAFYEETNPFAFELEEFVRDSTMVKISTPRAGKCPNSRGTAFDIPLINEISGNNAELSEAISNGYIELFSKEFEEVSENRDKLMRWMKNRVSTAKKLEAERRKTLPKNIQKLMGKMDAAMAELGITEKAEKEDLIKKWQISEN